MGDGTAMNLRPYVASDLADLYSICLRTGDHGNDASGRCSDPRLLGDYYAAPYVAFDPRQCLVLADKTGVFGYVLGAADTRAFVKWFNQQWLPAIRLKYAGVRPPTDAVDAWLLELLRQDASVPPWAEEYPAHLHIDLLPCVQRMGWGRRMMHQWARVARELGAGGLHLGVSKENHGAICFYERLGMHYLQDAGPAWIFGVRLPQGNIPGPDG